MHDKILYSPLGSPETQNVSYTKERRSFGGYFLLFLLILIVLNFCFNYTTPKEQPTEKEGCECLSKTTGKTYNFCYSDPQNMSSIGKRFDCGHLKYLEKLNLVDNPGPFVNLYNTSSSIEQEIVFVSAISDDHFIESVLSLGALDKFGRTFKYIIYGLNLSRNYTSYYSNVKNVEYRPFNTTGYPKYVNQLMTYRFKPLIVAEVLKEYANVFWLDAHAIVQKPNFLRNLSEELTVRRKSSENPLPSPITFFLYAGHSNFAVLTPTVLDYFPTNSIPLLKNRTRGSQLDAKAIYLTRTEYTVEIVKWWVLCALEEKCMNPPGAQLHCNFNDHLYDYYANCFRYDQSVVNLLLINNFQDHRKYLSELAPYFREFRAPRSVPPEIPQSSTRSSACDSPASCST